MKKPRTNFIPHYIKSIAKSDKLFKPAENLSRIDFES